MQVRRESWRCQPGAEEGDSVVLMTLGSTGEIEGALMEELTYEGYGPGGIPLLISTITDNRNRTLGEIKNILAKHGGKAASEGSVKWNFEQKGAIQGDVSSLDAPKDDLELLAIDAGAEDIRSDPDSEVIEVETSLANYDKVKTALAAKFKIAAAEITMLPQNSVPVTGDDARKALEMVEELEEHDDVQDVYANFDIPDDLMGN